MGSAVTLAALLARLEEAKTLDQITYCGHLVTETLLGREGIAKWENDNPAISLDAALALAERVLPGWWWTAGRCGLTCHASVGPDSAFIAEPDLTRWDDGFHADLTNPSTPAIALVAAAIKALIAQHPDAGPDGELGEDGSSRTSPSSPSGDPKGGA